MNPIKEDRRVRKTRRAILDALLSLTREQGLHAVTVGGITDRADINRATFYAHYRDKQDLIEQAVSEVLSEWGTVEEHRWAGSGSEVDFDRLLPIFTHMFEKIGKHAEFYRIMLGPGGYPGFSENLRDVMCRLIRHSHHRVLELKRARPLVDPDIYLSYVTSAQLGVIIHWLHQETPHSPEYMAEQLMLLYRLGAVQAADYEG
ncbi:TetR/AcrR family transcriptional regulator [Paenibacillus mucilaginosus]|uniref:Transcriptional regulator, TetR n=1 Tax=Paenibacillus mucilaginosus (strain KNP414) TaxID=1036673 RepID=F8FHC2_PAEMK|nr:TetR/AcrR family transcriptional regulator [Paenibacillus mucilaginosus]AEI39824.1 Transcriptional regulator, TetR [Paenibacillus mucilaginosus KNP414]MCG7217868.1 TetR/AcrR family transcriptional regulator [Paenibacillus mucilaginosus]WDM29104.1 TetR/AcrR family transcriptional regulator [Paenibacillus mucilaginosus]